MSKKKCVVLLSGGLDSATVAAFAKSRGFYIYALTFEYGQRHEIEILYAKKIAHYLNVNAHEIVHLPDDIFKISSLVISSGKEIPITHESAIPSTYVPARNIIFLSIALAYAETVEASHIFIGVNAVDYSGYPDCRPQFIEAFQKMVMVGTKSGVEGNPIIIEAPLINMTKAEIIALGTSLGVDYSLTSSCYNPSPEGKPCGMCDSCMLRKKGFAQAGYEDPALQR